MPNTNAAIIADAIAATARLQELREQRENARAELARLEAALEALLTSPSLDVASYRSAQFEVKRARIMVHRIGVGIRDTEALLSVLCPERQGEILVH